MNDIEVIKAFSEAGYQVSPEAVEIIRSSNSPLALIESVLSTVDESVFVIQPEHIAEYRQTADNIDFNECAGLQSSPASNELHKSDFLSPGKAFTKQPVSGETTSQLLDRSSSTPGSYPTTSFKISDHIFSDSVSSDSVSSDSVSSGPVSSDSLSSDSVSSDSVSSDSVSSDSVSSDSVSSDSVSSGPVSSDSLSSDPVSSDSLSSDSVSSGPLSSDPISSSVPGPSKVPLCGAGQALFVGKALGQNPVSVLQDVTGHSSCVGEYMQFVQYFRDRYSRLSEILRGRLNARPMESLRGRSFRRGGDSKSEELSIIGMVSEISSTNNGHKILSLEDPTGSFSVLIRNSDKDLFELASRVLLDEVIGATGKVTNDGNLMIATKLTQPDVPNGGARRTGAKGKAVLISDVHVGSSQFLEEPWLDFLNFIKGESDSESLRLIAKEVRYLVIAGDIVDGVGIYPDQEKELAIEDVYDQYRKAAEYLREIPGHIRVILSPGNHDTVRQAEPQPALPEKVRAYFPSNVTFVGNPSLVDLDGVQILIYHGRSIDDLVASIPGVSYQEPAGAMLEMLKRRHLAPTYGSRVSISPEKKDYFVIDPVPDIIHTGHVHTVGVQRYKNVLLVNSGTWQGQTDFQKRVNLMPVPAKVPVVDLADLGVKLLDFE
ncbi:MAG: DNA-directed DNA polymerase II small subunit [Methanosarcinaceae archaeon]|nr:DNA-directed DNA polymerase II small subunit [Methanosarcinaceae archaeon]